MSATIALTLDEARQVRMILSRHLPSEVRVFVFGSRAGGQVRRMSDLDLVLQGAGPLPLALLGDLADDFDESDLRWKVDLIDRTAVSPEFGLIIDAAKVPFSMEEWPS